MQLFAIISIVKDFLSVIATLTEFPLFNFVFPLQKTWIKTTLFFAKVIIYGEMGCKCPKMAQVSTYAQS